MTCTDAQVRQIMNERRAGKTQQQAALKANVSSRKSVRKYERLQRLPSEMKQPRSYRTRHDPFAGEWPQIEQMLEISPELEAQALFDWLSEQHPGRYAAGQVRTLQRRMAAWRSLHGEQVASLEQVRRPGELLQSDGSWLTELGVTIQGQAFKHLLIHCVLPYSNWEWGCIAQSESLLALREGVQCSVQKLGHAPAFHQTDNSTAATHLLRRSSSSTEEGAGSEAGTGSGASKGSVSRGDERSYHPLYLELLDYYGMQPRLTHVASPDENGDVESSHGGLKRSLRQQLLLRRSSDFESVAAYEQFVYGVMEKRNGARQQRLQEELTVMRRIEVPPLCAWREWRVRVSAGSLIRIQTHTYSVPTRLIGQEVVVRQYEWHLEVYHARQQVQQMPRLTGRFQQNINYRHLVDSLLRKPGGFRNYRFQHLLFPLPLFRTSWERLNEWQPARQADLAYLRILKLAASELECEVAAALQLLLETQTHFDETDVAALLQRRATLPPRLPAPAVDLRQYDALLNHAPLMGGGAC